MSINNPAEEQHREQLKIHVEALKKTFDQITTDLDKALGAENYTISEDGVIFDKLSEWGKTESQAGIISVAQGLLKKIYADLKQIDPDIVKGVFKENSSETIH